MFYQDVFILLGMGAESEERPHRLSSTEIWMRLVNLEERRESEDLRVGCLLCWLLASLPDLAGGFPENACCSWGTE